MLKHFNMVLKESQLKEFIKECVKKTLMEINEEVNEINNTGRDYTTVKNAYEKMKNLGQHQRAKELKNTFNDLSDDPNSEVLANYSFDDEDTVRFFTRSKATPATASQYTSANGFIKPNTVYQGRADSFNNNFRYAKAKPANDIAKHVANTNPGTKYGKNDFRA